jgi:hypothetical protein
MVHFATPNKTLIDDIFRVTKKTLNWMEKRNRASDFAVVKAGIGEYQFKKEHCSLTIGLPRRMGNTTLAFKLFNAYKGSFLIFPTRQYFFQDKNREMTDSQKKRIFTPRMLELQQLRRGLNKIPLVIVDLSPWMDKKMIDIIYTLDSDLFIFLG